MSLRFIYGRSGSGKSTFCCQSIANKIKAGGEGPYILLVPEQFSFVTEKGLIKSVGEKGLLYSEVLSFKKMARQVFKEVGGLTHTAMDTPGKCMILYKIMQENKENLKVFNRASNQQGFVNELCKTISEFKKYNISKEIMQQKASELEEQEDPHNIVFKDKLNDLNLIYQNFESEINKTHIDPEDQLTMLAEKLKDSKLFNNAEIWIDEFSSFTPQQYNIIKELLKIAKRVNITLNIDSLTEGTEVEYTDVFSTVKNTEQKLLKIIQEEGISYDKPIPLSDRKKSRFSQSQELNHLERYFYSYPYKKYGQQTEDIKIFKAQSTYTEIEEIARQIVALTRDQQIRYKDIAVVTRNFPDYEKLISVIFNTYEIPYFLDQKRDIIDNPIVVLIISALEIFNKNWTYESVFRYLKSGLLNITQEEIDLLENYVLAYGIRGYKKWTINEPWTHSLDNKSISIDDSNSHTEQMGQELQLKENSIASESLESSETKETTEGRQVSDAINTIENAEIEYSQKINDIRYKIIEPLEGFREKIKLQKQTVKQLTTALYEFLCEIQVPEKIQSWIADFKAEGKQSEANEYAQIWNMIINLMDSIVEVLGEENLILDEYIKILNVGMAEYQVGLIPSTLDQVLIGSIERVRNHELKYLFIVGANDGVFPKNYEEDGILNDMDRENFKNLGMDIGADSTAKTFEEQFLVYSTLSIPSKSLTISYPIADLEGKSKRPSIIISRLKKVFPKIKERTDIIKTSTDEETLKYISSPSPTFTELLMQLRLAEEDININPIWYDAYNWFENEEQWKQKIKNALKGLDYTNSVDRVSEKKVKELYGSPMKFSVSRLEKYVQCPYAYFIRYGLKAEERKEYKFTAPDLGSFMHKVMDSFAKVLDKEGMTFKDVEEDFCKEAVSLIVEDLAESKEGHILNSTPRYKYMKERLKRTLTKALWTAAYHIKVSNFTPEGFEVSFGPYGDYPSIEVLLPSGDKVELTGRIDRVDKMVVTKENTDTEELEEAQQAQLEPGTYIRIIDYKSGAKAFKLSDVYHGLQFQLLVYLDALLSSKNNFKEGEPMPGAILYFKIDDPILSEKGEISEEKLEKEILKKLKMNGLLLKDAKIIKSMDSDINGYSLVIPANIKKDGELGSSTSAATLEQFNLLREYVKNTIISICEDMLKGNIDIRPYNKKGNTPCSFCDYSAICNFEPKIKGNTYNILQELKDEEVWELIKDDKR